MTGDPIKGEFRVVGETTRPQEPPEPLFGPGESVAAFLAIAVLAAFIRWLFLVLVTA